MEVRLLRPGEEGAWNRYVDGKPESLLGHRAEWGAVLAEGLGHLPRLLIAEEGPAIRGVLPLAVVPGLIGGRALVSLPWLDAAGPLAEDGQASAALLRRAIALGEEERCAYVEIRALRELEVPRPVRSSKAILLLDLKDEEAQWKGFPAKVRNQVRKAEREGLIASVHGAEGLADFYPVFSRNMRDIGVPVWGREFFRAMLERFGSRVRVVLVHQGALPVGAALLFLHGSTAVVPSASSLRSHFALCPNHLLYWTALRTAREMGARVFDFGRSTPGSGTYHFKRQWGAVDKTCYWHYALLRLREAPDRSTESPRLRWAVRAWRRLPLPIANRLGPRIVRRIP